MSDDLFELGERIADLAARINIATFDMFTLVAEFDRREGWAGNFASCAEWLAWRPGRTPAAARENVRVAHALEELPLTAEVMKSGQLSYTKVRTMTRGAGQVIASAPPLPVGAECELPAPPPPPATRLSNGAARFVDSEVPLELELEALEAVA